jgi:hypothetical protein
MNHWEKKKKTDIGMISSRDTNEEVEKQIPSDG